MLVYQRVIGWQGRRIFVHQPDGTHVVFFVVLSVVLFGVGSSTVVPVARMTPSKHILMAMPMETSF